MNYSVSFPVQTTIKCAIFWPHAQNYSHNTSVRTCNLDYTLHPMLSYNLPPLKDAPANYNIKYAAGYLQSILHSPVIRSLSPLSPSSFKTNRLQFDASISCLTEHRRQSGVGTTPLQTHIYEPQPRTRYIRI